MTDTIITTLTKWGNSQGFIIPKSICNASHFQVGDNAIISIDDEGRIILDHKDTPIYARRRIVSLEEFAAGWQGEKAGEEWGGPDVGAEIVE